jgi:hypothetical protein
VHSLISESFVGAAPAMRWPTGKFMVMLTMVYM